MRSISGSFQTEISPLERETATYRYPRSKPATKQTRCGGPFPAGSFGQTCVVWSFVSGSITLIPWSGLPRESVNRMDPFQSLVSLYQHVQPRVQINVWHLILLGNKGTPGGRFVDL